jgi:hypothetical protein
MYGTVKCLPMSRSQSSSAISPSQSRLLTIAAPRSPEKSRKRSSWVRIEARFASRVSRSRSRRSFDAPDGSPIMPVPPPTTAIGRPPWRCRWISPKIGTRWPMWSHGPDGSKPL